MPATITRNLRIHNARQFKEAFSEAVDTKMYLFIGRSAEWANSSSPPPPVDTVKQTEFDIYRTMIAAKKISESDVQYVIPRVDWANNVVFEEFRDQESGLFANNYYVMTADLSLIHI